MELRQPCYFAAVAPRGSFNRAAKELHLTQPAVNRQVQNSGEGLGMTFTAVSEQFYGEARDLFTRADHAVRRVRAQVRMEFKEFLREA